MLKGTLIPELQWLTLTEGNPSIPGDGILISATNNRFHPTTPFSLAPVTDGLTVSFFAPNVLEGSTYLYFQVDEPACAGNNNVYIGGCPASGYPVFNNTTGTACFIPQVVVQGVANSMPGCGALALGDLRISAIAADKQAAGTIITTIDTVAIGLGQNNYPH